jgi:chaperonin GroES
MDIKPLKDRVVVKKIESETKQGELYLPDSAKEHPQQGEVVALGEGKRTEAVKLLGLDVKLGDRVVFAKYSGTEVKEAGGDYLLLREDEILGIIGSGLPGGAGTDTD